MWQGRRSRHETARVKETETLSWVREEGVQDGSCTAEELPLRVEMETVRAWRPLRCMHRRNAVECTTAGSPERCSCILKGPAKAQGTTWEWVSGQWTLMTDHHPHHFYPDTMQEEHSQSTKGWLALGTCPGNLPRMAGRGLSVLFLLPQHLREAEFLEGRGDIQEQNIFSTRFSSVVTIRLIYNLQQSILCW